MAENIPFNIVFVDDEEESIILFEHKFRKEVQENKVRLLTFSDSQKCFDFLSNNKTDLLVMFSDIHMPKVDGFKLIDKVKEIYPDLDIYFISAFDRDDYKFKADCLGAKGYLTKPVNFDAVKVIIDDYIERFVPSHI